MWLLLNLSPINESKSSVEVGEERQRHSGHWSREKPRLGSSSTEFMMKAMRAGFLEQEHGTGIFQSEFIDIL